MSTYSFNNSCKSLPSALLNSAPIFTSFLSSSVPRLTITVSPSSIWIRCSCFSGVSFMDSISVKVI
ncbi:hypothetical protein LguiA_004606 [Lonicera macranthoides]